MKGCSTPSTKAPINETIWSLDMSRTPWPKVLPPIHPILTTWYGEGILGKHSLTWGLAYPTGHLDTPPIPKFGKVYKVFEHLFNLKRGIWCTCLGGSLIRCGLFGMIHMTCRPLEGVLVCLCKTLPDESYSWRNGATWTFIAAWKPMRWMLDPMFGAPLMMSVAHGRWRALPLEAP